MRLRPSFSSSTRISVIGDLVINSYDLQGGKTLADVFRRDGTLVASELTMESPLIRGKRVGAGLFERVAKGRVEIWRVRP